MSVTLFPAADDDILWVADHMRDADLVEIEAAIGIDPYDALKYSVSVSSEAWSAYAGGEPIALFGVGTQSMLSRTGAPWLLGTDKLLDQRLSLVRLGKLFVATWRTHYEVMLNFVHAKNVSSIQWLETIGFCVHDPVPWGVRGEMFHPFLAYGDF